MAESICGQFLHVSKRLSDLGLDYITLDRAGATLSTGERQRVQLARAVRNRTTGVLYVLDEPSIGLHPANVDGLLGVIDDLIAHGNSVILVDHDVRVLKAADWLIEMGPKAGEHGGQIVAQGTIKAVAKKQVHSSLDFGRQGKIGYPRNGNAGGHVCTWAYQTVYCSFAYSPCP